MQTNIVSLYFLYRAFLLKENNTVQKCPRLLSPLNDVQLYLHILLHLFWRIFKKWIQNYTSCSIYIFKRVCKYSGYDIKSYPIRPGGSGWPCFVGDPLLVVGTNIRINLCCSQPTQTQEQQKLSGSRHVLIQVYDTEKLSFSSSPSGTRSMKVGNITWRTMLNLVLFGFEISWKWVWPIWVLQFIYDPRVRWTMNC